MPTWKQEVAEATTPIEGVNDVAAEIAWDITVIGNEYSPIPNTTGIVRISRKVQVKGVTEINARLIDGKNYIANDHTTEISFLKYLEARKSLSDDPEIIHNGVLKTLDEMRPIQSNYGIRPVEDKIIIGGDVWNICNVIAIGIMNDESGEATPAKLRFVLRKKTGG